MTTRLLTSAWLATAVMSLTAQVAVSGTITHKHAPLIDGVVYDGDTVEVYTDSLGHFSITVDSIGSTLYIGMSGYRPMAYVVRHGGEHSIELPKKYGKRSRRVRICGFCFSGGTSICMMKGDVRSIERIMPGDQVMAWSGDEGGAVPTRVVRVDSLAHDHLVRLDFDNGAELLCTRDHPIHVLGKGWRSAEPTTRQRALGISAIEVGDSCLHLQDGVPQAVRLISITALSGSFQTFNLTVAAAVGTYFANGILVSDEQFFNSLEGNGFLERSGR